MHLFTIQFIGDIIGQNYRFGIFISETWILAQNQINTMVIDAMAPCVGKAWAVTILAEVQMASRRFLIFECPHWSMWHLAQKEVIKDHLIIILGYGIKLQIFISAVYMALSVESK